MAKSPTRYATRRKGKRLAGSRAGRGKGRASRTRGSSPQSEKNITQRAALLQPLTRFWFGFRGRGRAGQGRAGQGRAGQGRAGQGRAGQQSRAGQGRAGQGRAGQGRAVVVATNSFLVFEGWI